MAATIAPAELPEKGADIDVFQGAIAPIAPVSMASLF
jgi:hypothetical protein